jgi:hypothetical protein
MVKVVGPAPVGSHRRRRVEAVGPAVRSRTHAVNVVPVRSAPRLGAVRSPVKVADVGSRQRWLTGGVTAAAVRLCSSLLRPDIRVAASQSAVVVAAAATAAAAAAAVAIVWRGAAVV